MAQIELKTALDVAYAWARMIQKRDSIARMRDEVARIITSDGKTSVEGPPRRVIEALEPALQALTVAETSANHEIDELGRILDTMQLEVPHVLER